MQQIIIYNRGRIKLNSYRPLCMTQLGINAIRRCNFPPFIDGSCRREPDFQNAFPSISALCRQGQFAPHLKHNDIIIYMTVGGIFNPYKLGHHLVAILLVDTIFPTHKYGYYWYLSNNLPIPSNCMVDNNPPYTFEETAGNYKSNSQVTKFLKKTTENKLQIGNTRIIKWDDDYLQKSNNWPCFIKTIPLYLNLSNPSLISQDDFNRIFGHIPNTRTPKIILDNQFIALARLVNIDVQFI